ncbi:MAG: DUF192 domain-containing protein [Alkalispirochaeta sp.]
MKRTNRRALRHGIGKRLRWTLAAGLLITALTGCGGEETVGLTVGDHVFQVEIADTPESRRQGLMFRENLGQDEGMLFVFPDSQMRSFWMKDTPLPLSIAYISARGRILEIRNMEPYSEEPVRSRFPARYALEVNRGRFSQVGISEGDEIDLSVLR